MATFQELARGYARRIREAIESDGFTSRARVARDQLRVSRTLREAKNINREIDELIYTESRKPLSDTDKRSIKELIDLELGLPRGLKEGYGIESASNDDLSDLADVIENILGGKK